ncbi:MAG: hypothetical protein ACREEW_02530 [Caulobacteraceae bacterium]
MVASLPNAARDIADEPASAEVVDLGRGVETPAQRIQRLQREARKLAREQIESFARDLDSMAFRAAEIAGGGEAYPVGAREIASRLADDLGQKSQSLTTLLNRVG